MKSVEWNWVKAHKITKTVVEGNINLLGSNVQLTSEGAGFIMFLLQKHVHIGLDIIINIFRVYNLANHTKLQTNQQTFIYNQETWEKYLIACKSCCCWFYREEQKQGRNTKIIAYIENAFSQQWSLVLAASRVNTTANKKIN
jgi:hypothetical protein